MLLIATIFFSIRRLHVMLLYLHNRSSQAKLLKADKADEVFNVTEETDKCHHRHFLPEIVLSFGVTAIVLLGNFFLIFY